MSNTALTLQIGGDISRLRAELNKANGLMNGFKTQLASVGAAMGVTFGAATVFQGLRHGVNVIGDFSHAMQQVRAITGATDKEFQALRKNALELGRTTRYTATQVAELQIAFGRLGFSNREIIESTEATLQLATATGEDLAKSADIAGSTLRAFNLDASEMQRVVDVMAASFNRSALGLDNFGESMKYVAPVAAAANISIEETTAMLGILADAGIRGSQAGTSLRKIISDVKGETGTLAERLQKLADKGLTGADAMDEVGRTAYASLLILVKHNEKVNEAAEGYKNVAGEAKKTGDQITNDLWGDIKLLTSALDGLILKFSEGEGSLRELTKGITKFIGVMSDDKVIKFLKEWFSLITVVPRKTVDAIQWLRGIMEDDVDKFSAMQEKRRKIWEDSVKKTLEDEVKKTGEAEVAVKSYTAAYQNLLKTIGFKVPKTSNKQSEGPIDIGNAFESKSEITKDDVLSSFKINTDEPVPGVVAPLPTADMANLETLLEELKEKAEQIKTETQFIEDAFESMTMNIAESLGNAIGNTENLGEGLKMAVLGSLGAMMVQLGKMAIQTGITIGAIKKALMSLNPVVAIAAGVALVALGSAVTSRMRSMGGGGSGGGGYNPPGKLPSEVHVQISGQAKIRGRDLVYVIEREDYRRSRAG